MALGDNDVFERAEVENLTGRPVLRLRRPPLPQQVTVSTPVRGRRSILISLNRLPVTPHRAW
jgi:hypothetical protein